MFYETLVTTNEIRAAAVRPCHESDLVATDRLYLQKSIPYQIIIYHIHQIIRLVMRLVRHELDRS